LCWGLCCWGALAQTNQNHAPAVLVSEEGQVRLRHGADTNWYEIPVQQLMYEQDRLRTLEDGQAVVELRDLSRLHVNPRSELVITPARAGTAKVRLEVLQGLLYFLHQNQPGEIEVDTPLAAAAIEGTEFTLQVEEATGTTTLSLLNGRVELTNQLGKIILSSGEQGVVEPGKAPRKTAVIVAQNTVQWCLYYPGVIDPEELDLTAASREALKDSLAAYREGDLLKAVAMYPAGRTPASGDERIFLDALELSSGRATDYPRLFAAFNANNPPARALKYLVAAVLNRKLEEPLAATNASQWLGLSYYRQSQHDLAGALLAARHAVAISTNFGFGWERLAEMEFSFGRTIAAQRALDRALESSPRNAQAHALRGFLMLAQGREHEARAAFESAIGLDSMLANPWLGRGLARIHEGDYDGGRADLETAAVLEPDRSLLRSYLAKAYAQAAVATSDPTRREQFRSLALAELGQAEQLDPTDPTPWLYSALMAYDEYRNGDAIQDLEKSSQLNDNRQVYRSRLLLDEDQAVRSANLANIVQDADMPEVSLNEAARAVSDDYANFSGHLNLAAGFDALRDPTRFNLRYETEWFNEHLLSTLLAPAGEGSLSEHLTQQEYSQLFDNDRVGLNGTTEYFGSGEVRQTASQFANLGQTSYALDLDYQHKDGIRPNNDLNSIEWDSRLQQQITPDDSLLLLVEYEDYDAGDNFQYYNPTNVRPNYRFSETQQPDVLVGWHHEWSPGVHTLVLAGRLEDQQQLSDVAAPQQLAVVNPAGLFDPTNKVPFDVHYRNSFAIYTAEANQIFQREHNTDILGVRSGPLV
jgi:hypothetical protein